MCVRERERDVVGAYRQWAYEMNMWEFLEASEWGRRYWEICQQQAASLEWRERNMIVCGNQDDGFTPSVCAWELQWQERSNRQSAFPCWQRLWCSRLPYSSCSSTRHRRTFETWSWHWLNSKIKQQQFLAGPEKRASPSNEFVAEWVRRPKFRIDQTGIILSSLVFVPFKIKPHVFMSHVTSVERSLAKRDNRNPKMSPQALK